MNPPSTGLPPAVAGRLGTATAGATAGVLGFVGLLASVRLRRTEAVDLAITLRLQAMRHPTLERLMTAVSWPGFPPQSRIIPPALIVALWLARLPLAAAMLLLGWGTAVLERSSPTDASTSGSSSTTRSGSSSATSPRSHSIAEPMLRT